MDREKITEMVLDCLKEATEEMEDAPEASLTGKTKLFGGGGLFDSLGLVSFLVDVEDRLFEETDLAISLSDEKALSQSRTPFASVDSFVDYILGVVDAAKE